MKKILLASLILFWGCGEDDSNNNPYTTCGDCNEPDYSSSSEYSYSSDPQEIVEKAYISVAAFTEQGVTTVAWATEETASESEIAAREECAIKAGTSQALCKSATSYKGCVEVYVEKQIADADPTVSFSSRFVNDYANLIEANESTKCNEYPKEGDVPGITAYCQEREVRCWESDGGIENSSSSLTSSSSEIITQVGEKAEECVQTRFSESGNVYYWTNICDYRISILWCGDLEFSDKRCGDGGDGDGFFTRSSVLDPGDEEDEWITGDIVWGACKGNVGFGHDRFDDSPDGSYVCYASLYN